jgi:hypothetical protein
MKNEEYKVTDTGANSVGKMGSGVLHYCPKCRFGVFSCEHDEKPYKVMEKETEEQKETKAPPSPSPAYITSLQNQFYESQAKYNALRNRKDGVFFETTPTSVRVEAVLTVRSIPALDSIMTDLRNLLDKNA